jgi:hypothetical protein
MAKPFMRVRLDKPKSKLPSQNAAAMSMKAAAKPKPMPKPMPKPAAKAPLKATSAEAAAIDRGNRAQAREAQIIRTTVRERTTPAKKRP